MTELDNGGQLDILGEYLRDEGIRLVEANTDERWRQQADDGIEEFVRRRRSFTVQDLRELGVPEPANPNSWGARFSAWSRSGRIRCTGIEKSARAERHAGLQRVWEAV